MGERNYFEVVDKDGTERQAELITFLTIEDNNRRYVVYRYNDYAEQNGSFVVEVSIIDELEDGRTVFKNIDSDEEWNKVKEKMREIILSTN